MWRSTILAVAALWAGAALAGEPTSGAPTGNLDLKPVGLPVVVDGRLVNYVLTDLRVVLARPADLQGAADKEPVLRDALVREASRRPFNLSGDRMRLDDARLKSRTLSLARALLGAPVSKVEVLSERPQYTFYAPPR